VCLRLRTAAEEEEESEEGEREGSTEAEGEMPAEEGEESSRPLKKSLCLFMGTCNNVCSVCLTSLIVLQLLSVSGRFPPSCPPSSPCCW